MRVSIIYTHFPHYRQAVFNELLQLTSMETTFYYDLKGIADTIKSGENEGRNIDCRTHRIGRFFIQKQIIKVCIKSSDDIFVFLGNPYVITYWLAAIILRLRRKKVYFWTHGWLNNSAGLKNFMRDVFYSIPNGLLLYGERARNIGIKRGFSSTKLHVIYNSLDYRTQKKKRKEIAIQKQEIPKLVVPYFLTVGRLVDSLGLETAIKALSQLEKSDGIRVPLKVVGDGPERDRYESAAIEAGVDVEFLGSVYDEDVLGPLFSGSIAVISPRKVGLLAMHSMAYGVPVITHSDPEKQMPEAEAIINNKTGFLFEFEDVDDLARIMKAVWSLVSGSSHDVICRERLAAIRDCCINEIETKYTPKNQASLIEAVFLNDDP